jgi:hypothetical protein
MVGVSASAALVFAFFAAPAAAAAAVLAMEELLLPIAVVLNQGLTGNGSSTARQGQCERLKTMMAVVWVNSYSPYFFLFHNGKSLCHPSHSF